MKPLRIALLLALFGAAPLSLAEPDLPQMGDAAGSLISPEEEKRLGEAFMREIRRSVRIIDDPELTDYLQGLGSGLASQADSHLRDFTFFWVDNPAINAFAAPGGYIGVHTGLILATEDESELASVVAHEVAHITQRHLPRSLEAANKMNLPTAAALVAALILGRGNSQVTEAALATTLAGSAQAQINFTRAHEQEADRLGMQMLAASQFDPRGMPNFFEKLQASYRFYDNNLPEFLSTHPVTTNRIADSRGRAEQYPTPPSNPYSLYLFMRAKTRVLTNSASQENLAFFKAGMERGTAREKMAARYGYALSLLQAGRPAEARRELVALIQQDPDRVPLIAALAAVDAAQHKYADVIARLDEALLLFPGSHTLTMQLADALIKDGQAEQARRLLVEHSRQRSTDPALYKLLAEAADGAGRRGESHYALAEHYYYGGETGTAVQQLKLAREQTPKSDFYLSARIDARMREMQAELPASASTKLRLH